MSRWVDDIVAGFRQMPQTAHLLSDLYPVVAQIRAPQHGPLPENWHSIVREAVQRFSADSTRCCGQDWFYHAGYGRWGLRPEYFTHKQGVLHPMSQNIATDAITNGQDMLASMSPAQSRPNGHTQPSLPAEPV